MTKATGRVTQIQGSVVDVEFPEGELPNVFEALEIPRETPNRWYWRWKNIWVRTGYAVFRWIPRMDLQRGLPADGNRLSDHGTGGVHDIGTHFQRPGAAGGSKGPGGGGGTLSHPSPGAAFFRAVHPHRDFRNRHQGDRFDRAFHQRAARPASLAAQAWARRSSSRS